MLRRMESSSQNMQYVISNSFQQFQQERNLPKVHLELAQLEADAADAGKEGDEAIKEYQELQELREGLHASLKEIMLRPQHCLQFLKAGRIVRVMDGQVDWGYGVIVNVMKQPAQAGAEAVYMADTMLMCEASRVAAGAPSPARPDDRSAEMLVIPVALHLIASISTLRISIPQDLRPSDNRRSVLLQLQDLIRKYADEGLPPLDPIEDMGIEDPDLQEVTKQVVVVDAKLADNPGT
eukprot:gene30824-35860_t